MYYSILYRYIFLSIRVFLKELYPNRWCISFLFDLHVGLLFHCAIWHFHSVSGAALQDFLWP